jgi:tetratricopeptide (TPR) repeat protein
MAHDEEAYELLHRASEALQRHGDKRGTARSLAQMGVSAAYHNRNDEARLRWQQALELYLQLGDQARVAVMLENLMVAALDPVEHERLHHEAYALYEQSGAVRELPGLLRNHVLFLSRTYGHYDQAREQLEQAIALVGSGDPFLRSRILSNWSTVALDQGDLVSAEEKAHEALELMKPFNNQPAEHCREDAWSKLAWVALAQGNIQIATEIAERHHDTVLQVRLALLRGGHEQAHRLLFKDGLDQLWKQAFPPREISWQQIQALLLAAEVAIARGSPNEAWLHLQDAVTLACDQVFVPSALAAFVVAAPLLASDEAEELLALAATHPAASFDTRQRARYLMTADPTGMGVSVLTTEGVLERGRSLLKS